MVKAGLTSEKSNQITGYDLSFICGKDDIKGAYYRIIDFVLNRNTSNVDTRWVVGNHVAVHNSIGSQLLAVDLFIEAFLRRDKAVRVSHAIDIREQSVFILGFGRLDKLPKSHDLPVKRGFARSTSYAMYRRCDCLTFSWSTIA